MAQEEVTDVDLEEGSGREVGLDIPQIGEASENAFIAQQSFP